MAETKRFGYKGYVIEPRSHQILKDWKTRESAGWVPHAWVYREERDTLEVRPIYLKSRVAKTQEAADEIAVPMACQWIDENG